MVCEKSAVDFLFQKNQLVRQGGYMPSGDYQIIPCHQCGANNRLPSEKLGSPLAKCGRCGASLSDFSTKSYDSNNYQLRCSHCKTRNRIPASKIDQKPKCGKCGYFEKK